VSNGTREREEGSCACLSPGEPRETGTCTCDGWDEVSGNEARCSNRRDHDHDHDGGPPQAPV
jgi:hypothetical protein